MKSGIKLKPFTRLLILSTVIILSLVLVFPLTAGCGGGASNTFLELMSLVPADCAPSAADYPVYLTLIDYASIYEDADITFATTEELFEKMDSEIIMQAISYGSYITGYSRWANTSSIRKEYIGYDITCIDAEIQFGYQQVNPIGGVAAIGRFDPQAAKDALSNQDEWPSWAVTDYATGDYLGVTIHSLCDGNQCHIQDRLLTPHIDELGRAKPLAVTDKYLFYAASMEVVKLMIDASQNQYSSLADLPEYAAIANGLSELKAYTAMVCDEYVANLFLNELEDESSPLSEESKESIRNSLNPPLKHFLTFGSGFGQDEKGNYLAIVIYHENSDNALENVSLLKQRIEIAIVSGLLEPWSSVISDTDIKAEGNVLLAKLYTPSVGFWSHFVFFYDNLLYHEE